MTIKKILLTGSNGYIGRALVPCLRQAGLSVVGIDRKPCPYPLHNLDQFIEGDLREDMLLKRIPDGVDTVCHLAAAKDDWGLSSKEYFDDNVTATRQLLRLACEQGIRNWIFFSSVAVLGCSAAAVDESAPIAPEGAYGESKAEAERLFRELSAREPLARIAIVRPSVVFGPGNPPNTNVYRLIDSIHNNRFMMVGKGNVIKTTSYIENVVAATLFLIERLRNGVQTAIYVDEPKLSTAEMVDKICNLLQKTSPRLSIPRWCAAPLAYLADFGAAVTRRDFPITAARINKFCRPTNFTATAIHALGFVQPVPIDEALQRTVQWYLTQK
jgi:nucleoside-diphosphate-sugar epimerase